MNAAQLRHKVGNEESLPTVLRLGRHIKHRLTSASRGSVKKSASTLMRNDRPVEFFPDTGHFLELLQVARLRFHSDHAIENVDALENRQIALEGEHPDLGVRHFFFDGTRQSCRNNTVPQITHGNDQYPHEQNPLLADESRIVCIFFRIRQSLDKTSEHIYPTRHLVRPEDPNGQPALFY